MEKSPLHRFAEEFRDTIFMYVRRMLGERANDPESWTAEVLREAATELARMTRTRIYVGVVPGSRTMTLTTKSPTGADVVPFSDLESITVAFIALDARGMVIDGGRSYVLLTLLEGGLSLIGEARTSVEISGIGGVL